MFWEKRSLPFFLKPAETFGMGLSILIDAGAVENNRIPRR